MKTSIKFGAAILACGMGAVASAEMMDRPVGIKIGQRMTLKPYVSVSATYDSNVGGQKNGAEDVIWRLNPGLNLEYKAEQWSLVANAFYQYNAYTKKESRDNNSYHSYGENLTFNWSNSLPGEKGWALMLTENFTFMNSLDSMSDASGNSYNRDRKEFKFAGALERRFGYNWHGNVNAGYYWLDYDQNNNQNTSYGLYGWSRWTAGAEIGYAASKWTDLLLGASYQGYKQDNNNNNYYSYDSNYGRSGDSSGVTVQGGFGSYATDRISYRVLGGWSQFKYGDGVATANGFTYSVSGQWKISETWKTMLLANSHYQPSERQYGSSTRVDSVSWGIAHAMVQGKLNGTFDVAYRRETRGYSASSAGDYNLDVMTYRLGLTYVLNRYAQFFGNVEYRQSFGSGQSSLANSYDYNRFTGTLGLRFTY